MRAYVTESALFILMYGVSAALRTHSSGLSFGHNIHFLSVRGRMISYTKTSEIADMRLIVRLAQSSGPK
jgi:hypothetical protein